MNDLSSEAANLNWLLDNFVNQVSGVVDAVVVSSDGLLMAMSPGIGRAGGDQLAAVASGLNSLTQIVLIIGWVKLIGNNGASGIGEAQATIIVFPVAFGCHQAHKQAWKCPEHADLFGIGLK